MAENPTSWEPNKNHKRVLSVVQSHGYEIDVVDACRAGEIHRDTYYGWFENPAFVTWWDEQLDRYFSLRRGSVIASLLKGAAKGFAGGPEAAKPVPALVKTFLERYDKGYAPHTRKSVEVTDVSGLGSDEEAMATLDDLSSDDPAGEGPEGA